MKSFFTRLKSGLSKTSQDLETKIDDACRTDIDSRGVNIFDHLEELLITSDLGVNSSIEIVDWVRNRAWRRKPEILKKHLKEAIFNILKNCQKPLQIDKKPFVIVVLGVNGVGKTTTIGKLASRYTSEGKKVVVGAADTFRAAAIEQLEEWGKRAGCEIIKQKEGGDPGAVVFDSVRAATARAADLLIIDTAGRLHTRINLMEELKKINRIVGREIEGAPHENLLVLDASTGQNALNQAHTFNKAVGVTGIALTKLDGTAKGGIIVAIARDLNLPIRFIGVGEQIEDLRDFEAKEFIDALI